MAWRTLSPVVACLGVACGLGLTACGSGPCDAACERVETCMRTLGSAAVAPARGGPNALSLDRGRCTAACRDAGATMQGYAACDPADCGSFLACMLRADRGRVADLACSEACERLVACRPFGAAAVRGALAGASPEAIEAAVAHERAESLGERSRCEAACRDARPTGRVACVPASCPEFDDCLSNLLPALDAGPHSCRDERGVECVEFGRDDMTRAEAMAECRAWRGAHGRYAHDRCPSVEVVAVCDEEGGDRRFHYAAAGRVSDDLARSCRGGIRRFAPVASAGAPSSAFASPEAPPPPRASASVGERTATTEPSSARP